MGRKKAIWCDTVLMTPRRVLVWALMLVAMWCVPVLSAKFLPLGDHAFPQPVGAIFGTFLLIVTLWSITLGWWTCLSLVISKVIRLNRPNLDNAFKFSVLFLVLSFAYVVAAAVVFAAGMAVVMLTDIEAVPGVSAMIGVAMVLMIVAVALGPILVPAYSASRVYRSGIFRTTTFAVLVVLVTFALDLALLSVLEAKVPQTSMTLARPLGR